MHILASHNYYRQRGGEDAVFEASAALLESRGHRVSRFTMHNDTATSMNRVTLAASTLWNPNAYRKLREMIRRDRPDVAHFMNTFPLLSPAALYAARDSGVPVVQTLHNYRLFCINGLFFRDGHVCETCANKSVPWPGVRRACYRKSIPASAVVCGLNGVHRSLGTWNRAVGVYLTLSDFARDKFIECGLPPEKLVVHPNFLYPDPGAGAGDGDFALFVGRLSEEKGLPVLLEAWRSLGPRVPLKIVGGGPLSEKVAAGAREQSAIEYLGPRPACDVIALMKRAKVLVFPSVWYEGLPMTIIEAFATSLPVIASDLGSMSSLIVHERTGLHFRPGDAEDLASKVEWVVSHPAEFAGMRREARKQFEAQYTAEIHHRRLLEIYERAIRNR